MSFQFSGAKILIIMYLKVYVNIIVKIIMNMNLEEMKNVYKYHIYYFLKMI